MQITVHYNSGMQKSISEHTERPYNCSQCGRGFGESQSMIVHQTKKSPPLTKSKELHSVQAADYPSVICVHFLSFGAWLFKASTCEAPTMYAERAETRINTALTFSRWREVRETAVKGSAPARPLRSASAGRLVPPPLRTSTSRSRLLSVLAPRWWNDLPVEVRTAETLTTFERRLKTHLFNPHLSQPLPLIPNRLVVFNFFQFSIVCNYLL